jgi:hypothetical protein
MDATAGLSRAGRSGGAALERIAHDHEDFDTLYRAESFVIMNSVPDLS